MVYRNNIANTNQPFVSRLVYDMGKRTSCIVNDATKLPSPIHGRLILHNRAAQQKATFVYTGQTKVTDGTNNTGRQFPVSFWVSDRMLHETNQVYVSSGDTLPAVTHHGRIVMEFADKKGGMTSTAVRIEPHKILPAHIPAAYNVFSIPNTIEVMPCQMGLQAGKSKQEKGVAKPFTAPKNTGQPVH